MQRWVLTFCLIKGMLTGSVWSGAAASQDQVTFDRQAATLMGTLLREHSYLLTPEQQEALSELIRQLREFEAQLSDRADPNPEMQRELARIAQNALTQLEGSPWIISLTSSADKIGDPASKTVSMPGDSGALLFQVDSGGSQPHYLPIDYDMSQTARPIQIELEPGRMNWVLVSLKNLPVKRSTVLALFRSQGKVLKRFPVDIQVPDSGRLKATILSADTNQPVPAMVQLVWKKNGRDRRPSNAINFQPQFDRQGRSDKGRRRANLPGKLGGRFWYCVPGPFDMALPPGEWEIMVRRGLEHVAVRETFQIRSGQVEEVTLQPRRWVDMKEHGWYSGDDHLHAQILSDSDAKNLSVWIQAEDVNLANVVKMGDIVRTFFEQRGFGKEYRVIEGDYILSPGQECPRTHAELGHTISMNITSMVRDTEKYFLYDWVFDTVHAQGGLTGYCHVLNNAFHVHRDMSLNVPKGKVDFVELLQFGNLGTKLYYDFLNNGFKLTASAGSDVPWGGTVGEVRLYAYVGPGNFSADTWFEAVRSGHTFVTNGPMIEFQVNEALPGDELKLPMDQGAKKLHVRAKAWGDPGRMLPTQLEIIRHGEVIESATPEGEGQKELTLDFEIDAEFGSWIAARASGSDGSNAHTTPVYVIRDPLRFWKFEDAEQLISERMSSLAEIEETVDKAVQAKKQGRAETRKHLKQLALQGPELMQRVEKAREIYRSLEETLRREAKVRKP